MLKNKHMTIAMFVAPLLAIASYFATDYIVSDLPVSAAQGEIYSMTARSNCRYQSGQCTFRNGDIEVNLQLIEDAQGQRLLRAKSSHPLKGATIALVGAEQKEPQTLSLNKMDNSGERWAIPIKGSLDDKHELRIAMLANATTFYGSTETTFFHYDTVFPRHDIQ